MFDDTKSMVSNDLQDGDRTDVRRRRIGVAIGAFVSIVLLMAVDLVEDWETGVEWTHLLLEGGIMVLALGGTADLWLALRTAEERVARLDGDLEVTRREAARYKAEATEALRGLGEAIDTQFQRWELTAAEREVGLLLLKGLSHKEAADVRGTSEQTVRQQALVVYRKSGLKNRSELSAFFLEDLLLPKERPAEAMPASGATG